VHPCYDVPSHVMSAGSRSDSSSIGGWKSGPVERSSTCTRCRGSVVRVGTECEASYFLFVAWNLTRNIARH
jgi:hypothetical protein